MKHREFGEPMPMRLIEEDRLFQLLEVEHRFHCLTHKGDSEYDAFEYFWDMMVESGLDQHVTHKAFVEAVKNMSFGGLAEMDLALYEEAQSQVVAHWTGIDSDQCSNCGRNLRDLMDGDSYYSSEFENAGFDKLVACPFCGARIKSE